MALMAGSALCAAQAYAADLTITSWGGAYSESQRKAYYEPYMKQGNKITEEEIIFQATGVREGAVRI